MQLLATPCVSQLWFLLFMGSNVNWFYFRNYHNYTISFQSNTALATIITTQYRRGLRRQRERAKERTGAKTHATAMQSHQFPFFRVDAFDEFK